MYRVGQDVLEEWHAPRGTCGSTTNLEAMLGTWSEHVDELLYDGERVVQRVDLEAATIVVTNDRVLVFTEGGDGPNYRTVERPNVARLSVETESALGRLVWATVVLVSGVGLLVAAMTIDLASLGAVTVSVDDPTGTVDGALGTVETLLTVLDLTVLLVGLLLTAVATGLFVRYIQSRSRHLVLRVTGDDDIVVPVTDAELEAERSADLQEVIGPDGGRGEPLVADDAADPSGSTEPTSPPRGDPEESG